MSHKQKKSLNIDENQVETASEDKHNVENSDEGNIKDGNNITLSVNKDTLASSDILEGFTLLIADGKALKLSPKTQNHVFFQLGIKDDDNTLHLRMSGNEGGGLHSKEWVPLDAITEILDKEKDKSIKSTILKSIFNGKSANNCGFMSAVLRSPNIGLLTKSAQSVFVHCLTEEYDANKAKLFAMAD